jgi:hemerythrin-like domain-containing protein
MTEHKTMNTVIHAAFRRDLARFDNALAGFSPGSRARANQLDEAWNNLSYQLHHHHVDEETIFWPALCELGVSESLRGDLQSEHAQMLSALDAADAAMKGFHAAPSQENASRAHATVTELERVTLSHLAHEERDLEPIAAAHRSSPQMKAAQKAVRKAHKGQTGTFFRWLLDGADLDAKTGLRREVPPPVLFVITRIGGRDYSRRITPMWANGPKYSETKV